MLFFTGEGNREHICSFVFQVHGYIFVLQIFIQMIAVLAIAITVRLILQMFFPK
ncbi:MAG: hypothetical protein JWP81_564 [Ferruginibacter sp.]|nr:hypothetical protein [Ferruginibacter sp.]